jgi:hypothetical protein
MYATTKRTQTEELLQQRKKQTKKSDAETIEIIMPATIFS